MPSSPFFKPQYCFYKADVPLTQVALGFLVPTLPRESIGQAVALLGSLIMPHVSTFHSCHTPVLSSSLPQMWRMLRTPCTLSAPADAHCQPPFHFPNRAQYEWPQYQLPLTSLQFLI